MRKKTSNFRFEKFAFFVFFVALALISAKSASAQIIMSDSSNILEIKASSTPTKSIFKFLPSTSANSFSLQAIAETANPATTISVFEYLSSNSLFKMLNGVLNFNPSAGSGTGYIGIGTTAPVEKLHVVGNNYTTGYQQTGGATYTGAGLWFGSNQAVGIYKSTSDIRFKSTSDLMAIAASGNVGIGTTTPEAKLVVSGGNIFIDGAVIGSSTPQAAITKTYLDSSLNGVFSAIDLAQYWKLNGSKLYASSTAWNVGIGTTNPIFKLDVGGTSRFSDTITANKGIKYTGTDTMYFENIALQSNTTIPNGFIKFVTPIKTSNNQMFSIDITGYDYGAGKSIDFTIVGYAYGGTDLVTRLGYSNRSSFNKEVRVSLEDRGDGYRVMVIALGASDENGNSNQDWYYQKFGATVRLWRGPGTFTADQFYWVNGETSLALNHWKSDNLNNQTLDGQLGTITTSGSIGIGTTAPGAYKLYVNGATYTSGNLNVGGDATITGGDVSISNNNGGINFNDASAYWLKTATNYGIYWDTTANQFKFNGAGVTKASIDLDDGAAYFNGSVGIGAITPSAKLHVAGDGSFLNGASPSQIHGVAAPTALTDAVNRSYVDSNFIASTSLPTIINTNAFVQGGNSFGVKAILGTNDNQALGIKTNGTEKMTILANGNVGVGKTSPSSKLHIVGSTVANFDKDDYATTIIEAADGRLEFVAADSGSNAAAFILNTVVGANDNRKWFFGAGTSADSNKLHIGYSTSLTDVNPAASSMFVMTTGGNVGIGTSDPIEKLHLFGNTGATYLKIYDSRSNTGDMAGIKLGTMPSGYSGFAKTMITHIETGSYGVGDLAFALNSNADISDVSIAHEKMRITSTGFVGVGTTAPAAGLEVLTGSNYSILAGGKRVGNVAAPVYGTDAVNRSYVDSNFIASTSLATITKAFVQNGNSFGVKAILGTNDNQALGIETNGTEKMTILANGSVGIGISNPNQQLEITKNFRLPATVGTSAYGVIYKGWYRFIHDFNYGLNGNGITTNGANTFVGLYAGNFTMGSTATDVNHASYNTGIGVSSLQSNTTGYSNSAFGSSALQDNTTGYNNTANGVSSLYYNTTGNNNTANGFNSLSFNTTGSNNSALGNLAGTYFGGASARESGDYGLYLGYGTRASGNGTNNEIVIGALAVGHGSNTATYGNTSMTKHVFEAGNVGIGTTTPSAKLTVAGGNIFITDAAITSSTPHAAITKTYLDSVLETLSSDLSASTTASNYWLANGTNIYNNTGNVGIGTSTPSQKLDVVGSVNVSTGYRINNIATNGKYLRGNGTNFVESSIQAGDVPTLNQNTAGYAGNLVSEDNRAISPSELVASRMKFGFTSYANNSSSPYADFLHFNSYSGVSGGNANLLVINKSGIGMRLYQQVFGTTTNFSAYKDVVLANNTPALNYLTKYASTGNSVTVSSSQVYDNGTKVGVGTTAPSHKLHVAGEGNFNSNQIHGVSSPSVDTDVANQGYVKSSVEGSAFWKLSGSNVYTSSTAWNVGIGVNNPGHYKLFVAGNSYLSGKVNIGKSDSYGDLEILHYNNISNTDTSFYPLRIKNDSWSANQVTGIEFWNGAQKDVPVSRIISQMAGDGGGGENLHFQTQTKSGTNPNPNNPTTKMTITNTGEVGIGTTAPSSKLHVVGNSYLNGTIKTALTGTGSRCLHVDSNGVIGTMAGDCGTSTGGDNLGNGIASTNIALGNYWLSGDGGNEGIFVKSDGNVGVGTNYPDAKLNLNGSASSTILLIDSSNPNHRAQLKIGTGFGNTPFFIDSLFRYIDQPTFGGSSLSLNPSGGSITAGGTIYNTSGSYWLRFDNTLTDSLKVQGDLNTTGILKSTGTGANYMMGKLGIGTTNPATTAGMTIDTPVASSAILFRGAGTDKAELTFKSGYGLGSLVFQSGGASGSGNVAIGRSAMQILQSSDSYNIAIGQTALSINQGSVRSNNIAIGNAAINGNSGNNNIALGKQALAVATAGSDNIAIGNQSGTNLSGNYNIAIGHAGASGNNKLFLGHFGDSGFPLIYGDMSSIYGGVAIATSTLQSGFALTVNGSIYASAFVYQGSDYRLKHDIKNLGEEDYQKILKLRPVSFTYNDGNIKGLGFIAQELEKYYPETVKTSENTGMKFVAYDNLISPAIMAIQEQQKKIDEQDTLIHILLDRVNKLENKVK